MRESSQAVATGYGTTTIPAPPEGRSLAECVNGTVKALSDAEAMVDQIKAALGLGLDATDGNKPGEPPRLLGQAFDARSRAQRLTNDLREIIAALAG